MSKSTIIVIMAVIILLVITSTTFSGFLSSHADNRTLGYRFNHYENFEFDEDVNDGDLMTIHDTVDDAWYEDNTTEVWFKSYTERPILFKGDLTSNYFIEDGTTIQFDVLVVEPNGIQYIEDFYTARNSKEDVEK